MPSGSGPTIFSRNKAALINFTERGNSSTNSLNTRPEKSAAHARNLLQFRGSKARLRKILQRHLAQAFLADQAKMNRGGQRVQSFVRADVRGGLLAADVLLARGERQHEAAAPGGISGLASQASGHLPHELFARGDHAYVGAAITRRNTKRLSFHRHNVRFGRRPNDAQRYRLGNRGDQ